MQGTILWTVSLWLGLVGAIPIVLKLKSVHDFDPRYPEEVPGMFQGDIDLEGRNIFSRNAIGSAKKKWPSRTIPFKIHSYFSKYDKEEFVAAMNHIEQMSSLNGKNCITFVNWTNEDAYMFFATGKGCHSPVGFKDKSQGVSLGFGCRDMGTVVHETLHNLGFYHEQSRPDRDSYIKLNMTNVQKGHEKNFLKMYPPLIDTQNLPYDYHSIMHYGPYAFAIDRAIPTIIPLKKNAVIGQRSGMSQLDIIQLQRLYKCPEREYVHIQDAHIVSPNCTFDGGFCGWQNVSMDPSIKNNTWLRQNADTLSLRTGPLMDHTIGAVDGYYLYTEASSNAHAVAKIRTPKVTPGKHCLQFWYHMYGKDMGTLKVNIVTDGQKTVNIVDISGNKGNVWLQSKTAFTATENTQVEFESITGDLYRSDMAIDDVIVQDGTC
ncbi:astacin-like metalloprotease toxin 2 [Octopus sinensis]|uniref:Metalloendopeptidase n=1 Tax=Octopus sinensis TaxID=2607531 RepID=A0A6P7SY51_9MOLL|nr:astacin-like metalloprotease toxin 2 [Octopus sinensis]